MDSCIPKEEEEEETLKTHLTKVKYLINTN
jgi:hypothetical protein